MYGVHKQIDSVLSEMAESTDQESEVRRLVINFIKSKWLYSDCYYN